jgi:prolyl-tRNA synthetase
VFAHRDLVEMGAPGPDIDWDGDLQPMVEQRTRLYAASDEMHDQARFEAEAPEDKRMTARGIEVGHIFYFGEKYSKPMKALVTGPDGQDRPIPRRLLRRRRLASGGRDHRGQPRRGGHHLAR